MIGGSALPWHRHPVPTRTLGTPPPGAPPDLPDASDPEGVAG